MNPIKTCTYESWKMFKSDWVYDLYDQDLPNLGQFIFRGQCDAEWGLSSTFDRNYNNACTKDHDKLFDIFKGQCKKSGVETTFDCDNEILALAQHHGLPTKLLDWTESIYIAMFFAASALQSHSHQNGFFSIWAIDITDQETWPEGGEVEIFRPKSFGNKRMGNQRGLFTLASGRFNSIEQYIQEVDEKTESEKKRLYKITLPWSEQRTILTELEMMGISFSRVYPDLEGCAKSAVFINSL